MSARNPYTDLLNEAVERANYWNRKGITEQAQWFKRLAHVHKKASDEWVKRRTVEILAARARAAIPVAKLAPPIAKPAPKPRAQPIPAIVLKQQPKKRKRKQEPITVRPCK